MMQLLQLFVTTPKGLELLLMQELKTLGAENIAEKFAGVQCEATLETAYRICLWSRFANRVLLLLTQLPAKTPEELYAAVQTIQWDLHLSLDKTFAVRVVISQSIINHTLFAAQKVKDAIVDQFREKYNERPTVSREEPDVAIYVYLHRDVAFISLDLSGESLHKRGYRLAGGEAPLKENLAAAILTRANWLSVAKQQGTLLDPLCGSGTLLIEAAMIAADIAPGLLRDYKGFLGWKQHEEIVWQQLIKEAEARKQIGLQQLPKIIGYDADANVIKLAFENIKRAQLSRYIHVEKRLLEVFAPEDFMTPGLIVTNPPYGERLSDTIRLKPLYHLLGSRLKTAFIGWKAAIFTGNVALGKQMGLRANYHYAFFNGAIACKLLLFDIESSYFVDNSPEAENKRRIQQAERHASHLPQPIELMNRLRKNFKHRSKIAKRQGDVQFCIYDCDLPEYKYMLEMREDALYVTEYASPKSVSEEKILLHRAQLLAILPEVLAIAAEKIYFSESYERHQQNK